MGFRAEVGDERKVGTPPSHQSEREPPNGLSNLRIFYTNARSVINKMSELRAIITDLTPDIVAVSETWTNESITNSNLNIYGYSIVARSDRNDTAEGRGGGILVFAKDSISAYQISTNNNFNQSCSISIESNQNHLHIHIIYRSPNCFDENNEKLNIFLNDVNHLSLLIGDYNFPDI